MYSAGKNTFQPPTAAGVLPGGNNSDACPWFCHFTSTVYTRAYNMHTNRMHVYCCIMCVVGGGDVSIVLPEQANTHQFLFGFKVRVTAPNNDREIESPFDLLPFHRKKRMNEMAFNHRINRGNQSIKMYIDVARRGRVFIYMDVAAPPRRRRTRCSVLSFWML